MRYAPGARRRSAWRRVRLHGERHRRPAAGGWPARCPLRPAANVASFLVCARTGGHSAARGISLAGDAPDTDTDSGHPADPRNAGNPAADSCSRSRQGDPAADGARASGASCRAGAGPTHAAVGRSGGEAAGPTCPALPVGRTHGVCCTCRGTGRSGTVTSDHPTGRAIRGCSGRRSHGLQRKDRSGRASRFSGADGSVGASLQRPGTSRIRTARRSRRHCPRHVGKRLGGCRRGCSPRRALSLLSIATRHADRS